MLIKLFVTLVQFGVKPSFVLDQRKIEKVQRRATRLLLSIRDEPYRERLLILQLPSLAHRRHSHDMILYKILNICFSSDFSTLCTVRTTQIPLLLGDISLNYLNIAQD